MAKPVPDHQEALAEEARGWIVRMASGAMQADELAAFKAWRIADPQHNAAFERERALWRGLQSVRVTQPRRPVHRRGIMAGAAALAATAVLLLVSPRAILWWKADHQSGSTIENLVLPDGSRAILDADSAIAVQFSTAERRIVLLKGEAWFDVRHDSSRPFRVAALGGVSEDVGTAFEVRRGADQVTVGVSAGIVRVGSSSMMILHAGERAHYARGGPVVAESAVAPATVGAWRDGELLLDNAPVADAIRQVARYRRAPVFVIADLSGRPPISADFRTDRPDEALQAVASMANLRMLNLPGGIVLLRPAS